MDGYCLVNCHKCRFLVWTDPDAVLLARLSDERYVPDCWNGCHIVDGGAEIPRNPYWADTPNRAEISALDLPRHWYGRGRRIGRLWP